MNPFAAIGAVIISANPLFSVATGNEEHDVLLDSLRNAGVRVVVNHHYGCSEPGINGLYASGNQLIVICQDNAEPGDPEVEWTPNDLNTLRHEAQHVLQDCLGDDLGDGVFRLASGDTEGLMNFLDEIGMPESTRDKIIELYIINGANWPEVQIELEAFGVAATVPPNVLASEIDTACAPEF